AEWETTARAARGEGVRTRVARGEAHVDVGAGFDAVGGVGGEGDLGDRIGGPLDTHDSGPLPTDLVVAHVSGPPRERRWPRRGSVPLRPCAGSGVAPTCRRRRC